MQVRENGAKSFNIPLKDGQNYGWTKLGFLEKRKECFCGKCIADNFCSFSLKSE